MRYILVVVFLVMIGAGAFFFLSSKEVKPEKTFVATAQVIMTPTGFEPETLTVKKNTKVIFKNQDSRDRWPASNLHPTHGIYPEFDPLQGVPSGQDWEFIFDKAGKWKYHDHLFPTLRGLIVVEN